MTRDIFSKVTKFTARLIAAWVRDPSANGGAAIPKFRKVQPIAFPRCRPRGALNAPSTPRHGRPGKLGRSTD